MPLEHIHSYILDTFFQYYETDADISIGYGTSPASDVVIIPGNISFFDETEPIPSDFVWHTWRQQKIPFLFNRANHPEVITIKEGIVFVNYDILAASFYFLSNWQEIHQPETDHHERFPYKKSIQYTHDFVLLPVVNYYYDILKTAIEKSGRPVHRKQKFSSFQVFLSHDVDNIKSGWMEDCYAELKRGNLINILRIIFNQVRGNPEWDNIDEIIKLEKELDVVSTFFFLTEYGSNNADYKLKEVTTNFDEIKDAGSEIALHGSLGSALNPKKFQQEIEKLDEDISGNRFHFLKIDAAQTPHIIDKAGLDYSCSQGFAEQVGFRNSFCFPFHPFDLKTQQPFQHLQIPLMLMDATLHNKNYMGGKNHRGQVESLIKQVALFNGVFSILWHNTYFTNYKFKGWKKKYVELIKKLHDKDGVFLTGENIADIYSSH